MCASGLALLTISCMIRRSSREIFEFLFSYLIHYLGEKLDMFMEKPSSPKEVAANTLLPSQIRGIERAKLDQRHGSGFILATFSGEAFTVRFADPATSDVWFDDFQDAL
jgi:hypothetical protein